MRDLLNLSETIIKILNEELIILIKGGIYKTHEAFMKNIERFSNFCLQDTHPDMYQLNCFTDDAKMKDYIDDLKYFAENGGFIREY